jgi:hypothetical protein
MMVHLPKVTSVTAKDNHLLVYAKDNHLLVYAKISPPQAVTSVER